MNSMPKTHALSRGIVSFFAIVVASYFFGTAAAHANPSMLMAPHSGPIGTKLTLTVSGLPTSLTYVSIRFDKADFPEYQPKIEHPGTLQVSFVQIPKSITKRYQSIPITPGNHTIDLYQGTILLTSATFLVTETSSSIMTITPSSGPIGTLVSVRVSNPPSLKLPQLRLKDGKEQVTFQEVKAESDGTLVGTYTIPKEVVQGYDVSGKAIIVPIVAGTHSLWLYEAGQVTTAVSAPFIVTEPTTAPTPTPTPTPAPTPTPVQDANICNPDIPSYSQPGCKPKETATVTPSLTTEKTCDPNIPSYAQPGCTPAGSAKEPEKKSETPASDKKICDPNIPSYSQVGCVSAGSVEAAPEKKTEDIIPEGTRGRRFREDPGSVGKEPPGKKAEDTQLEDIQKKTQLIKDNRFDEILAELKELRSKVKEQETEIKYLRGLTKDFEALKGEVKEALTQFIAYGVDRNSQKIGAGERAAVLNSYKEAYDKLPESDEEMSDMIKIVNGRFPSERNAEAEGSAIQTFKRIYKRVPNLKNNRNDVAAIMVMTYGLRQAAENRNLASEKRGIETFTAIFGKAPQSTDEWNTMQAITYSGAARKQDRDKDLLSDDDEKIFGTNPAHPDTDKDGANDGLEVERYSDPLNSAANSSITTADWLLPKIISEVKNGSGTIIEPAGTRGRRFIEDAG